MFPPLQGGPDAHRYIALARHNPVPRPFHLRWLLPRLCGTSARRWWTVWSLSWPVCGAAMFWWASAHGWRTGLAAAVMLLALPGILGPKAVIPVGVDLPATALTVAAAALYAHDLTIPALVALGVAAAIRETSPLWLALWVWSPLPLIVLAIPLLRAATSKPGPDPLGPRFQDIADHPIRSALDAHRGRWRDAWLMVTPWGVCLAGLYRPSVAVCAVVGVAYLQLLVATDTVRLIHHAAGPALAIAAAQVIPPQWLLLACVVHVAWWRTPERI